MAATYIEVTALPDVVRAALADFGYRRKDIAVSASETFSFHGAYGDGYKAIAIAVELATGHCKRYEGSWGGANPFTTQVADSGKTIPVAPGFVVIDGQIGGGRPTSASLTVHPTTMVPLLPAPVELTESEASALRAFGYKSGPYRQDALRNVPPSVLDGLVSRGLLSRNKAGATQLTTAGRNAKPRSF